MDFYDENENKVESMSAGEKLSNPGFLIWLLKQYASEIEILERKLQAKPAEKDDGTKQLSRVTRLDRLRNYCAPFVLVRLRALKAIDGIDQNILRKFAA